MGAGLLFAPNVTPSHTGWSFRLKSECPWSPASLRRGCEGTTALWRRRRADVPMADRRAVSLLPLGGDYPTAGIRSCNGHAALTGDFA